MAQHSQSLFRQVLLAASAGAGGSYLYRQSEGVSEHLLNWVRTLLLSGSNGKLGEHAGGFGTGDVGLVRSLADQVDRLSFEVKQLAGGRAVTVVTPGKGQHDTSSLFVAGLGAGAAGCTYLVLRGRFGDMMFVTRRGFKQALGHLKASMENVGGALCKVKTQLNARIESVLQQVSAAARIQDQLRVEVGEVKERVNETGQQVDNVEALVGQLQGEIESVKGKQDFANRGIYLLCSVVAGVLDSNPSSTRNALNELREFAAMEEDENACQRGSPSRIDDIELASGLAFLSNQEDGVGSVATSGTGQCGDQ
mmetsp:Transcript_1439/g.4971  ORF Transcript_1439/g.4971 Transcript_1439/m.4971 type:complete len:309 (-) Transcript_1439:104-1030(-)